MSLEDLRQDEHRHVAADAVRHWPAIRSSSPSIAAWRAGVTVVQLEGVGPAGEVRVAASRESGSRRRTSPDSSSAAGTRGARPFPARTTPGAPRPTGDPAPRGSGRSRGSASRRAGAGAGAAAPGAASPPKSSWTRYAGPQSMSRTRRCRAGPEGRGGTAACHSRFDSDTRRAASPVCQTPRNQTRSNPSAARRSSSSSGMSSRVAGRPSVFDNSESRMRVLILVERRIPGPRAVHAAHPFSDRRRCGAHLRAPS